MATCDGIVTDRENHEAYVDGLGYVIGWLSCSDQGKAMLLDLVVAALESTRLSQGAGLLLNDMAARSLSATVESERK